MCTSKPKTPEAPPAAAPTAPVVMASPEDATGTGTNPRLSSTGRRGLRIDLASQAPGGSGLKIPL